MAEYLLEIGCEEIPATMVESAVDALADALARRLTEEGLGGSGRTAYGGPRRLAVIVHDLLERQPDRDEHLTGPPVARAFDADDKPTRAAIGFAAKLGIDPTELERVETKKGWVVAGTCHVAGRSAGDVIADIVPEVVRALAFRKTMRWGTGAHRFVRAIRSVVSLLDDAIVPLELGGVRAGRTSFGHRFLGDRRVTLATATDYVDALAGQSVIVASSERHERIASALVEMARAAGGVVDQDEALLDEVTHLVEFPSVVCGQFDAGYLELPAEILVTSMKHHQKCFPIRDQASDRLRPAFLAVANVPDTEGHVQRGYERVLHARLADARFFWTEDRKRELATRIPELDRLILQERLGSYGAKVTRIIELVEAVSDHYGADLDAGAARAAARLAKADLGTDMVGEFPELQGICGGLYLQAEGRPEAVWRAVYEHYRPASLDEPAATSPIGAALAIADRLDTLVGCFGVGLVPTGTRDPLGLRRAAHGVIRTLLDHEWAGRLEPLLERSADLHQATPGAEQASSGLTPLCDYLRDRMSHALRADGHRADTVEAVLSGVPIDPVDARRRAAALTAARAEPDFAEVSTIFKRVANITGDGGVGEHEPIESRPDEERRLYDCYLDVRERATTATANARYGEAIGCLRDLARPLHEFFEAVLVMDPDLVVRENRLRLLRAIGGLAGPIANFACLQVERERGRRD